VQTKTHTWIPVALLFAGTLASASGFTPDDASRSAGTPADAIAVVLRVETPDEPDPSARAGTLGVGALLYPGDSIVPAGQGRLLVLHADGRPEWVSEPARLAPEAVEASSLFRVIRAQLRNGSAPPTATTDTSIATEQADLPHRPTGARRVRSLTPTLTWHAHPDAERYRVHLWVPEGRIVTAEVGRDTVWSVPLDHALTPGMEYEWAVELLPAGRISRRATFSVAPREVMDGVARELGHLRVAGLDPAADGLLAAAILFRSLGLPYDAADALSALRERGEPWSPGLEAFGQRLRADLTPRGGDAPAARPDSATPPDSVAPPDSIPPPTPRTR
jgi:hypothetical protein